MNLDFYFTLILISFIQDSTLREDRLYFFQFPSPFPKFINPSTEPPPLRIIDPTTGPEPVQAESPTKKVSFAPDTKLSLTPASSRPSTVPPEHTKEEPVDGIIGQLEVYKSGAVKIRLANGILLDVSRISITAIHGLTVPLRSMPRHSRHSFSKLSISI